MKTRLFTGCCITLTMLTACSAPAVTLPGLGNCSAMSGADILAAFEGTVDNARVLDISDGRAVNHWHADGRLTSEWSGAGTSGSVEGTWRIEDDRRCVVIGSHETCSPLYECDEGFVSINTDGSVHGVHDPQPMLTR